MAAITKAPSPLAGTTSTVNFKASENVKTTKKPQISPVLSLISGGVAGGVEATITVSPRPVSCHPGLN